MRTPRLILRPVAARDCRPAWLRRADRLISSPWLLGPLFFGLWAALAALAMSRF